MADKAVRIREEDLDDIEGQDLAGKHLQYGFELALPRLRAPRPDAEDKAAYEAWNLGNRDHENVTILYSLDEKVLQRLRDVAFEHLAPTQRKTLDAVRRAFLLVYDDGSGRIVNMAGIDTRRIDKLEKSLPSISRLLTMQMYDRLTDADPKAFIKAFMTPSPSPERRPDPAEAELQETPQRQEKKRDTAPFMQFDRLRVVVDRAVSTSQHYPGLSIGKGQEFIATSYIVSQKEGWVCYLRIPGYGELIPFPCDAFEVVGPSA